jgi:hypothetical protein
MTPQENNKMFLTEDDLNEISPIVHRVLGKSGALMDIRNTEVIPNVVVWNRSIGKMWYGDVESLEVLKEKCLALSKLLAKEVCVSFTDTHNFFVTPKFVFTQI